MKKCISGIITLLVLMVCLAFSASAGTDNMPSGPSSPEYSKDGFYYDIIDSEISIRGYYAENAEMVIPETIDGYNVTVINMMEYYVPNYQKVTSIYFGSNVKSVLCEFSFFDNLKSITVSENNQFYLSDDGVLFNKTMTELVAYPAGSEETEYIIPDCVETISGSFSCPYIKTITVSDKLEEISGSVFSGCDALERINLGKNVQVTSPFYGCPGIKYISVDSDNEFLCADEYGVLFNKDKTELIQYPKNKEKTAYIIPDGVKIIGDRAFEDSENLLKITIPEGVETIGYDSFHGCSGLTEIFIPDSITKIGQFAFDYCSALESVSLGKNIETIDRYAFANCYQLKEIVVPDNVKEIGYSAFYNCKKLNKIQLPDSIELIGENVFEETEYYNNSKNWTQGNLYIGKHLIRANTAFDILPGTKTIAGGAFYSRSNIVNIIIPASVVGIGENAFYSCEKLKSISIPESVKSIDDGAFSGCSSLTDIILPEGITKISAGLFENCSALEYIRIPENIKEIDKHAFADCEKLSNVYIPDGVEAIGFDSFYGCKGLKNIIIPASTGKIDFYAFEDCDNLNGIVILNFNCKIADDAFTLPESTVIYGFTGSTAEQYAEKYNRVFIPLCHENVNIYNTVAATCKQNGLSSGVFCNECDEWIVSRADIPSRGHSFTKYVSDNNATCVDNNSRTAICDWCDATDTIIDYNTKTGHKYNDNGVCNLCGDLSEDYEPDEPATEPDEPATEPDDTTDDCSCNCHQSGFMGFIWKILRIFYKLFKINPVCACGAAHY